MKTMVLTILLSLTCSQLTYAKSTAITSQKLFSAKFNSLSTPNDSRNPTVPKPIDPIGFEKAKLVITKDSYEKVNDKMEWVQTVLIDKHIDVAVYDLKNNPGSVPGDYEQDTFSFEDIVNDKKIQVSLYSQVQLATAPAGSEKFGLTPGTDYKAYMSSLDVSDKDSGLFNQNELQKYAVSIFATKELNLKSVWQVVQPSRIIISSSCSVDSNGNQICEPPSVPEIKVYYSAMVLFGE